MVFPVATIHLKAQPATLRGLSSIGMKNFFLTQFVAPCEPYALVQAAADRTRSLIRLPQFSNNCTSHVEVQGSLSDRTDSGKRAPSSISLVPALVVFAISVSTAFAGALRTANARSFTVTRLAGLNLLSTSQ